jgi:pyruvate dehydrogenase E2 component (dihydrolipoamide acetyltransferase)
MPIQILMPALSPTMAEGNLVRWLKQEGDTVAAGDVIAEIETDKATMEVEAVDEGTLGKILVPAGTDNVKVNELIALLLEEGEDASALASASTTAAPVVQKVEVHAAAPAATSAVAPTILASTEGQRVFASPLARRIAENQGIDLQTVQGSGPHGRIVKADVENMSTPSFKSNVAQPTSAPLPARSADGLFPAYDEIKLSNMRKVIAKRLTEAKQTVPHFYLTIECELDALLALRKDVNQSLEEGARISVNDFIIKAIAMSLKAVPAANASYAETHVRQYHSADISVAVAIEGGLVTPVVRAAETKSLSAISQEVKGLVAKARAGKLVPEEYQGGTFSLSNLGMFGIQSFSAVINPPQGCILAVGTGEQRAVVKKGQLEIATVMNCTLSVDHRVVDGAVGAEFLKHFKRYITHPVLMLV